MADVTAQLAQYRQAPRKVRLVADLVRGKSAARALALLSVLPKKASEPMQKLIQSAIANASKSGNTAKDLFISKIDVQAGPVSKRHMPRARGRASLIHKRTSHLSLVLSVRPTKEISTVAKK